MCRRHVACPFRERVVHDIRWPTDVRDWAAAGPRGASTLSNLEENLPRIVSGTMSEGGLAAWIALTKASQNGNDVP